MTQALLRTQGLTKHFEVRRGVFGRVRGAVRAVDGVDLSLDAGQTLVDTLWERLLPLGIEREERPWRPHFTLVRRVRRPPPKLTIPAVRWSCDRLALVESVSGPDGLHYTPLAEWPLGKS